MELNTRAMGGENQTGRKQFWAEKLSPHFLIGLVFLVPLFFLPYGSFLFDFSKVLLLVIAVLGVFAFWLITRLRENKVTVGFGWLTGSLIFVAITYLISAIASSHKGISLAGLGFETETASVIGLLVLLTLLVSFFFREKNRILYAYSALVVSTIVIALFHIVRFPFLLGTDFLSFNLFLSSVANTIGTWTDFGIFFGLMALVSFISLEMLTLSKMFRGLLIFTLVASFIFLALVNAPLIWYVLGICALFFFMSSLMYGSMQAGQDGDEAMVSERTTSTTSLLALSVLIISFIFIIANGPIKNILSPIFNISFTEARPSWQATLQIAKPALRENPVFGVGPNQFGTQWLTYKPEVINQSAFWNTDFSSGIGFIPTSIVTTGLLGLASWLLFLGVFIYLGFMSLFSKAANTFSRYYTLSTFFGAAYLWAFSIFYVPSPVMMVLTFFFTGLFIAAAGDRPIFRKSIVFSSEPKKAGVFILVTTLLLMATAGWAYVFIRNFVSHTYFAQAIQAYSVKGNLDEAEQKIVKAITIHPTDVYYRTLSTFEITRLQLIAADTSASPEALRSQFQNALTTAVNAGQAAVNYNNKNYLNAVSLGQVYELVVPFKIPNAYESAVASYTEAAKLNPKNPAVTLLLGRLEAANGNYAKAKEYIGQALTQKPDYLDAVFLLSQVQVSEGDVSGAIQSVEAAAAVTPNNPTLFFQLGLLRYNNKEYTGAAGAFEQAVALVPDYANAKYFLGLSYERLGKTAQAIALFEDLDKTNPNNQEIQLILSNLRSGRPAFTDAEPPIDSAPEKRKELPLKETSTSKTATSTSSATSTEEDNRP
jgi:tetratricopeptide (TPR) repeat protein